MNNDKITAMKEVTLLGVAEFSFSPSIGRPRWGGKSARKSLESGSRGSPGLSSGTGNQISGGNSRGGAGPVELGCCDSGGLLVG